MADGSGLRCLEVSFEQGKRLPLTHNARVALRTRQKVSALSKRTPGGNELLLNGARR